MISVADNPQTTIEAIRAGFERTPTDVLAFAGVLGVFAAVLAAGYASQSLAQRRKTRRLEEKRLARVSRIRGLTGEESRLLAKLSGELRPGNGREQVALERAAFEEALERLGSREALPPRHLVASLLRKLGLTAVGHRRSTRALYPGLRVRLEFEDGTSCEAVLRKVLSRGLLVRVRPGVGGRRPGEGPVRVSYSTPVSRCSFRTWVREKRGRSLLLEHRKEIRQAQDRRFHRSRIDAPAYVAAPGGSAFVTKVTEIGAGGATILSETGQEIPLGSPLKMVLGVSRGERLAIYGRVVRRTPAKRRSERHEKLHLQFEPLHGRLRRKIMTLLLTSEEPDFAPEDAVHSEMKSIKPKVAAGDHNILSFRRHET